MRLTRRSVKHTYKGASGLRIKTFIPETIVAIRMMVQEWVNMRQEKCRGRSENGKPENQRGPENQRDFWVKRNQNIRRRLNGDRERRHEEFLINLEQIKEFPKGVIESGELFHNDEILRRLVDPEAVDNVRVRDWNINKEALFLSFATRPAESDLYEWC